MIEPPRVAEGALLGHRTGGADGERSPVEQARGTMTVRRPAGSAPTAPESLFRWGWPGRVDGRSHLRRKWHAIPEYTGWENQRARCGIHIRVLVGIFPELPPSVKSGERCGNCRDLTRGGTDG